MDCLGHNWFTGARKQETMLVHRLTEADKQVPRGCLGAHCCQRCTVCDTGVQRDAGNSPVDTGEPRLGGGVQKRESPCCWEAWGAPVSALEGQWRGGHWVQARALRL